MANRYKTPEASDGAIKELPDRFDVVYEMGPHGLLRIAAEHNKDRVNS